MTNEESKKLADSVDWSFEFTESVSTTCRCRCGFEYRSHMKVLWDRQSICSVSKDACPQCGSHANMNEEKERFGGGLVKRNK